MKLSARLLAFVALFATLPAHADEGLSKGQYAQAPRHLRLDLEKLPGDRSAALWLYLARLHLGEGDAARTGLEKIFARDDKVRAKGQVCLAKTMMGARAAAMGDMEKAKSIMFHRPECGATPAPDKST